MKVCKTISEIRSIVQKVKSNGKSIGLVPTMGALHTGHLGLIEESKNKCDVTITSIFVNPTQFNNPEDLKNYPRTTSADLEKLENAQCDLVFLPDNEDIYPKKPTISIDPGPIANELEGKFRSGHFDGVGLVVSKLFNIVQPNQAFFGQKDLQQFFIIKALVEQINFPIDLKMVSTLREESGLALSSRNMRLSDTDKKEASLLYVGLKQAQELLLSGIAVPQAKQNVKELFDRSERLNLEYFEVVHTNDFKPTGNINDSSGIALCIAAEIGQVRLIDNLMLIS